MDEAKDVQWRWVDGKWRKVTVCAPAKAMMLPPSVEREDLDYRKALRIAFPKSPEVLKAKARAKWRRGKGRRK